MGRSKGAGLNVRKRLEDLDQSMRYLFSLVRIASKLRALSLFFVVIGGLLTVVAAHKPDRHPYLILFGPALTGFAGCAIFSLRDKFLFRGVGDAVYMATNNLCSWHIYRLGPEEVCAFGGDWHEIFHVSERVISEHLRSDKTRGLSLRNANLFRVKGQKTVYAILSDTRYGIPDEETLRRIWSTSPFSVEERDSAELDRFRPGGDLRSVQYWPERFRRSEIAAPTETAIKRDNVTETPDAAHKDYLLFIAQDTLNEIRENKKNQRELTFNFVLIAAATLGFYQVLKGQPQVLSTVLPLILGTLGAMTVYSLYRLQRSLADFRRRITKIWDDAEFQFAFDRDILKYRGDDKAFYYSFKNNFIGFTLPYMFLVSLVTILLISVCIGQPIVEKLVSLWRYISKLFG